MKGGERMIKLDDNQKLQVLIIGLQERYHASHQIRGRSIQFALWISGMAIGLSWLLICQTSLELFQQIALTLLIGTLFSGTIYFMAGLRRGFSNNRKAMVICERALLMHDSDVYLADEPLLPKEYNKTGKKWGDHFRTIYVWLILVALSLVILTWSCPSAERQITISNKTEQTQGGDKK
jgi:hypothetical protein